MNSFQYVTAGSPEEAISLVGKNGRYLAGGIDLLGMMKDYIVTPDVLVNVKDVKMAQPEGNAIRLNGQAYELGALVTVAEIAAHEELKKALPGLVEAASEVGSPQIRNVASLAGNLLQHSRCWYYRQPDIVCLKRGGSTCYGQEGENKYLSLFSGCACISPIVSNLATVFAALNAQVNVREDAQTSLYSIHKFYQEAWENPAAHNSLKPQNFILNVSVPTTRARSAYRQQSEKREFDWALVSCAAAGNVTGGRITDARVALGAVAPVPYVVEEANQFLEGKELTAANAAKAADIILRDAKPLAHNGYKVPLAHALIRRALLALNS
ncbi:MAG TPA: FAD binding domain-containing protein [Candidatus Methylacidiphilales bacterium]|nr:FAD binding domain-containing protein [Candidatus Methylacidiphilales bacterium]